MNEDESFQLFCQKATGRDHREEAFLEKSKLAINYAEGLPLALCVLGSFFCGRNADEWEKALDMLKKESDNHMHEILKIGYGALTPEEKAIFLDIACFFNMWRIDEVTQILDSCGFDATIGICSLIRKSLVDEVEIGNSKYIKMHTLIQDMGRSIVQEEYPDHAERCSRLWSAVEIDEILENNKAINVSHQGTDATEGVVLPNSFQRIQKIWNSTAFSTMKSLRMLIISCNIEDLSPSLEVPGKLKVLHWDGYPLKTLPSSTNLDEPVCLKMRCSKTELLSFESRMDNLKFLDLSYSKGLIEIPNFLSGSYAEWKSHRLNADSWASISIKTFSVTILGTKIPSWFQSQKTLRLDEEDESSIIEDVPSSVRLLARKGSKIGEAKISSPPLDLVWADWEANMLEFIKGLQPTSLEI
ncbi:TMV resistance protein N-like [Prosopis cineraria]|uniref:TMV resistance protein N-like n=1 Tax=Prosopis cineraria TaxID=364024 RepID=UPI00240EF1BB|nr:TMV resistance protein N-like [Prosopis cineraria]